jgi:sterol desaturase/sphingolipid hydroxylase (fatty acid hydroxylase superfamily)
LVVIQWAVCSSATISNSTTPTIPETISSHGRYLGDEGNNKPFFFIPVFLVGACNYLVLPIDLFVVQVVACAASFWAHVIFDKEYDVEGSRLQRFAWFRRKQALHFVHHRHADSNFAVIDFFWDRILATYRRPDPGA